jgi:hypothetical protein
MTTTDSERILTDVPGMPAGTTIIIKKLGYASLSKLRSKSVDAKISSDIRNMDAKIDMGNYHKYIIIYGVKSAPFFSSISVVDREREFEADIIPAQTGEYLFNAIQTFNGFAESDDLKKE